MAANSGLKFYIGGNDPGQTFVISSIQVQSIGYTWAPTLSPTTARPTTASPTNQPSVSPTKNPTNNPTKNPTNNPTKSPSNAPSFSPTLAPTPAPTNNPSAAPSYSPSIAPTPAPTENPTPAPTSDPSAAPSNAPTSPPSAAPTQPPSKAPTPAPTDDPTNSPSFSPSKAPSGSPSQPPSAAPTLAPVKEPTNAPTSPPTTAPSNAPSSTPTGAPTSPPSRAPTPAPTENPTKSPSTEPTIDPTVDPTSDPTLEPTTNPTSDPTIDPTTNPTTAQPTVSPITRAPSMDPTSDPTKDPTTEPTVNPTSNPTEHCPWTKPCHARKTSLCCSLSDECQWAAESYAACDNGNHDTISCCINTPMPTPFPTQRPSSDPTAAPSKAPTTTPPTQTPVTVILGNDTNPNPGGNNPEDPNAGGAAATDAFGDLILPVVLVVVVGACALCCVIIVIARQIFYNRKKRKVSFDADDDIKPDKKKKKKRGHYNHAQTQSIEMGGMGMGVSPFDEPDGDRRKGTGDKDKKYGKYSSKKQRERERNDIIDGQILTVPMRDGQRTKRAGTNQFSSNIANIASGNNVLMDDVVEQIGNGTSFGNGLRRHKNKGYGIAVADDEKDGDRLEIAGGTSKASTRDESVHSESEDDLSQEPDVDPSPTESNQTKTTIAAIINNPYGRGNHNQHDVEESDDRRAEKPELHNYSTNLMALAPNSMITESEQKLSQPPAHEPRKQLSIGPKAPGLGYHDITNSQFGKLQRAINNAKTASDFEKLEQIIKSGQIPDHDWHGKGSKYNSHGGGSSFKGMVARAFDPNTVITSQAMSESEDVSDHAFIYKMNSQISNTSISTFGQSHQSRLSKLPNMQNTDSVATVDSIGVKMPQYRRNKNKSSNNHQSAAVKGNLDDNELMNKLAAIQKGDKSSHSKSSNNKRGREKKYIRGDSSSTNASSNKRGQFAYSDDNDDLI
eukprot:CAMPEP_0201566856 /NCGR_PEP_ID=MMETSP0190_2-20130828/6951_1 /ASSEMBLY_ACC=CAM_ASM_000263 /TAXON_ID=37353 /ORGANISM="Rosalina sp." /LENGTH=951 /DNA_ID=CAMNT_0047986123 /DNA_START=762 /DNA_END=3617 /DNA_ORIENTATION=+